MVTIKPFRYKRTLSAFVTDQNGKLIATFHGKTKIQKLTLAVNKIRELGAEPTELPPVFWCELQLNLGRRNWQTEMIYYCKGFPDELRRRIG